MTPARLALIFLALSLLLAQAPDAHAHPGGLDANGGHHDRKHGGYHYHTAKPAFAQEKPAPRATQGVLVKVERVSDGDTIVVTGPDGAPVKVRLYGIDAPEKDQPGGSGAAKAMAAMVQGKTVSVTKEDTDRYGRTVARIEVEGKSVNAEMIRQGWAWVYTEYCKRPECVEWKRLEAEAREKKLGLWSEKNPTPPNVWRHAKR